MATEIELKLLIEEAHDINVLLQVKKCLVTLGIDPLFDKNELENAYYDTPDLRLNAERIALRVRRKGGQYIQTLKTKGQSVNGLSKRGEWEWSLTTPELNGDYLVQCDAWPKVLDADKLIKVFETNFTRQQITFTWKDALIELAIDCGSIISQGNSAQINEIELELKSGGEGNLHLIYEALQQYLSLTPFDVSKAERGYRLGRLVS